MFAHRGSPRAVNVNASKKLAFFVEQYLVPPHVSIASSTRVKRVTLLHVRQTNKASLSLSRNFLSRRYEYTRSSLHSLPLYRLLMQLDNEPVVDFEHRKAFVNDSAKAGASAIHAAEDRALQAEIAQYKNKKTMNILWDIKICLIPSIFSYSFAKQSK